MIFATPTLCLSATEAWRAGGAALPDSWQRWSQGMAAMELPPLRGRPRAKEEWLSLSGTVFVQAADGGSELVAVSLFVRVTLLRREDGSAVVHWVSSLAWDGQPAQTATHAYLAAGQAEQAEALLLLDDEGGRCLASAPWLGLRLEASQARVQVQVGGWNLAVSLAACSPWMGAAEAAAPGSGNARQWAVQALDVHEGALSLAQRCAIVPAEHTSTLVLEHGWCSIGQPAQLLGGAPAAALAGHWSLPQTYRGWGVMGGPDTQLRLRLTAGVLQGLHFAGRVTGSGMFRGQCCSAATGAGAAVHGGRVQALAAATVAEPDASNPLPGSDSITAPVALSAILPLPSGRLTPALQLSCVGLLHSVQTAQGGVFWASGVVARLAQWPYPIVGAGTLLHSGEGKAWVLPLLRCARAPEACTDRRPALLISAACLVMLVLCTVVGARLIPALLRCRETAVKPP